MIVATDNLTELSADIAVPEYRSTDTDIERVSREMGDQLATYTSDSLPTVRLVTDHQSSVDSTNVADSQRQVSAASLSAIHSPDIPALSTSRITATGSVGNPMESLGNPAAETVSVREYCEVFEQWAWQYYWWMMHIQWMTWAAYSSVPMYTPMSCIPSTSAGAQQSAVPAARPAGLQQQQQQQQQQRLPQQRQGSTFELFSMTELFID